VTASSIRLAITGVGKIVRDQHLPHLALNPAFEVVAAASPASTLEGVPMFADQTAMLASGVAIDAVAICTPPQVRHALAREALGAGKHVLLEKPPGVTVSEVEDLKALAARRDATLYVTWHSRHAPGVARAAEWLKGKRLDKVEIIWREDVRRWHPGQAWIWQPGGLGVFDPGINALSIATLILPPFFVKAAELEFPANCDAPIAARVAFDLRGGAPMTANFDWRQTGPQTWDIRIDAADGGRLRMSRGGDQLELDGQAVEIPPEREYGEIYETFAALIRSGRSDIDVRPLQQVADAFMLGRRIDTDPFHDIGS
jgi:D-galactose 1-dehydrogenase